MSNTDTKYNLSISIPEIGIGITDLYNDHARKIGTIELTSGEPPQDTCMSDLEADGYVNMIKALPEDHSHGHHVMPVLALVPRSEATHIAICNGNWSDSKTWYKGIIPTSDSKVLIPEDFQVIYDTKLFFALISVRIDGELKFKTDIVSVLSAETIVVSPTGKLEIGSIENPVAATSSANIEFLNNGILDPNRDPKLLGRGLISLGKVSIHGAQKTAFSAIENEVKAGDTTITLPIEPYGWKNYDDLVITGTHLRGWSAGNGGTIHRESEDEEVTITKIEGKVITFTPPLQFDHDTPRTDLRPYAANLTRNISFYNEDSRFTPVNERAHVMFMHNNDVDIRYAAFNDLGRTDKSYPAFDVEELTTVTGMSNIQGRYSLHFHMIGTEDKDNPIHVVGCSASGSAGWAFVNHSSNVNFYNNVAYEVFGAAFSAEDGDEIGEWSNNIAIKCKGIGAGEAAAKRQDDVARHDSGRTGDGFFFAGRIVHANHNVAANCTHGYVWMHRGAPTGPLANNIEYPELARGQERIQVNHPPIEGFSNNEAFGTTIGLMVIKANPNQHHDIRTVLKGFSNWETASGAQIAYTAHYTLTDFDILGTTQDKKTYRVKSGIHFANNTTDITVINGIISDFPIGIDLDQHFTFENPDSEFGHKFVNMYISRCDVHYHQFNSNRHQILTLSDLDPDRFYFASSVYPPITSLNEPVYLPGTKFDSIGSTDRDIAQDDISISVPQLRSLLQTKGYHTYPDDTQFVMKIDDFIADRATGKVKQFFHVIDLNVSKYHLDNLGAVNNGPLVIPA